MSKKKTAFLSLFVISLILGAIFRISEDFAELYTLRIAPIFRLPLSFVTSVFPFSVGESIVLLLIVMGSATVFSLLYKGMTKLLRRNTECHWRTYLRIFCSIISFIYFAYVFAFSSSYSRVPVSDTMGLEKFEMTKETVSEALDKVIDELNSVSEEIKHFQSVCLAASYAS